MMAFLSGIWGRIALVGAVASVALTLLLKLLSGARRSERIEVERDALIDKVEEVNRRRDETKEIKREIDALDRDALIERLRERGVVRDQ